MPEENETFKFEAKVTDEFNNSTKIEKEYNAETFEIEPVISHIMQDFKTFLILSGYSEEIINEYAQQVFVNEEE